MYVGGDGCALAALLQEEKYSSRRIPSSSDHLHYYSRKQYLVCFICGLRLNIEIRRCNSSHVVHTLARSVRTVFMATVTPDSICLAFFTYPAARHVRVEGKGRRKRVAEEILSRGRLRVGEGKEEKGSGGDTFEEELL